MDVDELNDGDLLTWFDLSDDAFPWRADAGSAVHARRAAMGGQLFVDMLLPAASDSRDAPLVDNESMDEGTSASGPLFPPTDTDMFRRLLVALQRSPHTSTRRDSIALYLMCAWYPRAAADPNGFTTGPDGEPYPNALDDAKLREFAQARLIAPQYASLARAYFLLDNGVLEPAVAILSDARILPEWSSKILHTLSLPGIDATAPLVLKYVRCAKPTISDMDDVNIYLSALVKDNFMDAWLYQRSFPTGPFREQCIRRILDLCLLPQHSPAQLKLLVAYPFDAAEEAAVSAYAQDPPDRLPAKSLAVLRQLLLVRLIQSGRYTDALKFDRTNPVPDHDESRIKERRALMRHVIGLVPRAVREDVEREFTASRINGHGGDTVPSSPKRVPSASGSWALVGSNSDLAASTSMTMSWEDLSKSVNGPPSAQRRTSYSRLEGPAAPTFGTPSKRVQGHALAADSPGRGRAYDNAGLGSLRTPTLVAMSQPSTTLPANFQSVNRGLPGTLHRGVQPIYNAPSPAYQPSPAAAFAPVRPLPLFSNGNGSVTPSKRPLPESPLIPAVRPTEDVEMIESDDPDAFVVRPQRTAFMNGHRQSRGQDVDMTSGHGSGTRNGVVSSLGKQDSLPAIPGAFPPDRHEEPQAQKHEDEKDKKNGHRSKRQRQVQNFEIAPEEPKKAATTRVRTTRRTRRTSMPGEMPDMPHDDGDSSDEHEQSEEEDAVPALPSKKPVSRTTTSRRSRASSSESEAPTTSVVRRSTRLSTVAGAEPAAAPPIVQTKKKGRSRASVEPAPVAPAPVPTRKATRRSRMTLDGVEE